ncbi:N-formylglutamate amidohydrolase [Qipengyuania sp.]|uniref:N-formylglutamate amidohydrolase n=1 Tax=Qipengyuania sp. TaxID=2004515 RepID=UPI0035C7C025
MPVSTLLNPSDPHPVREFRGNDPTSPFLLLGDHAGRAIPAALCGLGLHSSDHQRHIALDLGVESLGRGVAERLGATFLSQAYSRLVVDCNRAVQDDEWIVERSDGTLIPGNAGLTKSARQARFEEVYKPYHEAIARELDRRAADGIETILVSLHSFTPTLSGVQRPWEIGVLHDGHRDEFALALLMSLEGVDRSIGDNKPYHMDNTDYTVPFHAYGRDLRYVELEFRQDILVSQLDELSALTSRLLRGACATVSDETKQVDLSVDPATD